MMGLHPFPGLHSSYSGGEHTLAFLTKCPILMGVQVIIGIKVVNSHSREWQPVVTRTRERTLIAEMK